MVGIYSSGNKIQKINNRIFIGQIINNINIDNNNNNNKSAQRVHIPTILYFDFLVFYFGMLSLG